MAMGLREFNLKPEGALSGGPDPVEVTSWMDENREILVIKIKQIQAVGSKRGSVIRLTWESCLRFDIGEGQQFPEIKPSCTCQSEPLVLDGQMLVDQED